MMKKIEQYIKKYHMIENGDRIIAGISGGADSVCLLFVLLELRKKYDIDVIAVHVNHCIRGEAALADEKFTVDLCAKHHVKCKVFRKEVELIARNRKQSVEEAGRDARREAFDTVLREENGTKIAMAHHQNDNAETLLMNIVRGTGLKGLGGIRPVNGNIIRPLLCLTRNEIEEFVQKQNCGWCTDETNNEQEYTRNKIRHSVLPILEQRVNGQAVQHMNETMAQLCQVWEYMEMQTDKAMKFCVDKKDNTKVQIFKESYDELHDVIKQTLLQKCIAYTSGAQRDITAAHIEAIYTLMNRQCGKSIDLPYGLKAVRNYEGILLYKAEEKKNDANKEKKEEFIINIPGETYISKWNLTITCKVWAPNEIIMEQIPQKNYTKWFDYDIMKGTLIARNRHAGDHIVIDKTGKKQKIKSYFVNEKIPAEQRDQIPLICDDEKIMWIVGYRMSSACQVTRKTKNILEITVVEGKKDGRED